MNRLPSFPERSGPRAWDQRADQESAGGKLQYIICTYIAAAAGLLRDTELVIKRQRFIQVRRTYHALGTGCRASELGSRSLPVCGLALRLLGSPATAAPAISLFLGSHNRSVMNRLDSDVADGAVAKGERRKRLSSNRSATSPSHRKPSRGHVISARRLPRKPSTGKTHGALCTPPPANHALSSVSELMCADTYCYARPSH